LTVVVGLEGNGRVLIGADSAGVSGYDISVRSDEKVFRVGPYVFGFVDSFRMGQLLRYSLEAPELPNQTEHLDRFLATTFIDAVRYCLDEGGFAEKKDNAETGGVFLLGVMGRLYRVDDDYQIARNICGYDAAGAGENYAIGSLFTTRKQKNLKSRVQVALEAAAEHSAVVAPPFRFVENRT
jgi:hypothetical protein